MVFVGKGPDQEKLEQQARWLGLMGGDKPDQCIFVGPVYDRDTLRAWNCRADLFLFPSTFDTNGLVVREAAACGLASVLIEGSCAAEGVTHGRNGFTIEETPQAMTALLSQLCGDLPHLHQVGQNAMEEIYLSWQQCVNEAYRRYEQILARKKIGMLHPHHKDATDYLVHVTAKTMMEQEKVRRLGKELFHDFRETAMGMMENMQDSEDHPARFWDKMADEIRSEMKELRGK